MRKLYFGGDIITMVTEQDTAQALLVEDQTIRFVGNYQEAKALAGSQVEEIDLRGKTLAPSFIDGHSHISMYSRFAAFPSAADCTSFSQIRELMTNYIKEKELGPDEVLLVTGYDHNFLKEERHPDRCFLDEISKQIPIFLMHASGHLGVANTRLLELAGIPLHLENDPQGGHFGRYEDGTLNGYAEEMAAIAPILMKAFAAFKMDPVKQLLEVQKTYLSYGVTTVQDGGTSRQILDGFVQMAKAGVFTVDIVAYPNFNEEPEKAMETYKNHVGGYENHFKIAGSKIFLDGSPQGKTAWMTEPYEGEESYLGYPTQKDETVISAARAAIRNGYQLLAHCNGDAASDQFIRCYQKALELEHGFGEDLRPVMIHCQTVRDDQLKRMADIGMLPSIFVAHTYFWGDVHLKNLGMERGNRISPVASAKKYGLKYNFHQDCPVLPPDMMRSVWCAVNRVTRKGVTIGKEQRVSTYDAMCAVTKNAAYAYHEENIKGTLEAGKLADLVILGKNPLKASLEELKDIPVLETIKNGNSVYRSQYCM